ncbi:MAG: hypothetical protein FJ161_03850, partial [Gammaproteobacteria bacterium]|nr:hypothetical protein [Gammaproteobacteria bacterium]
IAARVWIGTFHGLSNQFLRKYGSWIGLKSDFQIITPSDQKKIFKQLVTLDGALDLSASEQKNILYLLGEYYRNNSWPHDRQMRHLIERYLAYIKQNGLLDFDALIIAAQALFERPEFQQEVTRNIRHVLVDEFQDTNPAQFLWIQSLLKQGSCGTFVGDDDQSIYGFRGADLSIIQTAEMMLDGLWTIKLEQNYRSTPHILNLANTVIAQNKNRLGKTLWTDNPNHRQPVVIETINEYQEAQEVCRMIHELLHRGVAHQEIAILYRSHALSRLIEAESRKYQWPYQISGGLPFFEREEIRDIMSYLQVIDNPKQSIALMRIINKPARKIGEKTQQAIMEYAEKYNVSCWESMLNLLPGFAPQAQKAIRSFCELIEELRGMAAQTQSLATFADQVIARTQLLSAYNDQDSSDQKADNLYQFHLALRDYQLESQEDQQTLLRAFLNDYLLDDRVERQTENCLTLSTCHAAKGLEWPYVFIIGAEKDYFPHEQSQDHPDMVEEERRLFYVAMTRAKKEVYFFHTRSRQKYHEMIAPKLTPFLEKIDGDLLEWRPIQKKDFTINSSIARPQQKKIITNTTQVAKILNHPILGVGNIITIDTKADAVTVNFRSLGVKVFRYSLCKDFISE